MKTETLMKIIITVVALFSVITLVIAYDFTKDVETTHTQRNKIMAGEMCNGAVPTDSSVPAEFCQCLAEGKKDVFCKMFLVGQ